MVFSAVVLSGCGQSPVLPGATTPLPAVTSIDVGNSDFETELTSEPDYNLDQAFKDLESELK
jgi:hypothetical protein